MSLASDLLEQARHLVLRDVRRPRQANLRRGISSAYFSLFHLLVAEASSRVARGDIAAQTLTARAYDHGEMRKVSRAFQSGAGAFPTAIQDALGSGFAVSADLRVVAAAFWQLQQLRHDADYNTAMRFSREDASDAVDRAEEAFAAWERVRATPEARLYLLSLLLWSRWTR